MYLLTALRQAQQMLALKKLGVRPSSGDSNYAGDGVAALHHGEVARYPRTAEMPKLMVDDPASPNYGKLCYMAGVSVIGGDDIVC